MLPRTFQQYSGTITTVTAKGGSEKGPFRHPSNHVIRSQQFGEILNESRSDFFSKCFKFYVDFKNAKKLP